MEERGGRKDDLSTIILTSESQQPRPVALPKTTGTGRSQAIGLQKARRRPGSLPPLVTSRSGESVIISTVFRGAPPLDITSYLLKANGSSVNRALEC